MCIWEALLLGSIKWRDVSILQLIRVQADLLPPGGGPGPRVPHQHHAAVDRQRLRLARADPQLPQEAVLLVADLEGHLHASGPGPGGPQGTEAHGKARHINRELSATEPTVEKASDLSIFDNRRGYSEFANESDWEEWERFCLSYL